MPRPKRTKVAPSAPAPRVRKTAAKPTPPVEPEPQHQKASFSDLYDVSDPEEEVLTSARHVKKSNGKRKAVERPRGRARGTNARSTEDDEIEEAGNDLGSGRVTSDNQGEEAILDDIDLGSSSPSVEVSRRDIGTPGMGNSSFAIGNFRRRARQPSILGRNAGRGRSSSVESNLAADNGLTTVDRTNTSMAIGNFKGRPRQNSIPGRNAAPMASSMGLEMERGTPAVGSALKIGNFKRRAREPSILGTAQKRQAQRPDFDDDNDKEEDDFNPEDESTPINLSKTRAMTTSTAESSSNPRKRKLSAVQVPRSSPSLPSSGRIEAEETIPATGPLDDEEEETQEHEEQDEDQRDSSPQEDPILSVEARSVTPEPMSETMAPPMSSSSPPSSPEPPLPTRTAPIRARRTLRGGRTPPPRTQDSPISSPPSLTHSPNRPTAAATKHKPKRQAPPPSAFSTAQLQALMPRRRRRADRDPFDIASSEDEVDTSGLASDDDELSHLNARARIRRPTGILARTPAPLKKKKPGPNPKEPAAKRTYGGANGTSDKENEGEIDPDDSLAPLPDDGENAAEEDSQELEKRIGKELKRAARKFAEVDKWEMEFEDVTASSSSPRDAR